MARSIAIVTGTRPEIIKMLPVKRALDTTEGIKAVWISSGQQRELCNQAFGQFGITPDVDLSVMRPNQTLPELTARLLTSITQVLEAIRPAAILVHGDTTTAFAAAVAAFYQNISIGHVEAGLRTYDLRAPWPEEMNRRLIDPMCKWCFAPTNIAKENLLAERIPERSIFVTGNTVIDTLILIRNQLEERGESADKVARRYGVPEPFSSNFLNGNATSRLVLVTGHRRESFGRAFENICHAIRALVDRNSDVGVIYPVHLNPNVQEPVRRILGGHPRIQLIAPVSYSEFVLLMNVCRFLLTDSGGVQEEAPSLGKPVLVMRDTTERPEGVLAGTSRLVGTDVQKIVAESESLLRDEIDYARRVALQNPYGDGLAGTRIAETLASS